MHRTSFVAFGVYDEELAKAFRAILYTDRAYPIKELGVLVIDDGLLTSTKLLCDVDPSSYIIDSKICDDGYDDYDVRGGRTDHQRYADKQQAMTYRNVISAFSGYFSDDLFNNDMKLLFLRAFEKGRAVV